MIRIEFEISYAALRLSAAAAAISLLLLLLAIRIRRRRIQARARELLRGISHDFVPIENDSGIEAFRREVDASHKAYERRILEEEWRRDGGVLLERRKPLPGMP
ncbi:MAG TPA: hypothetical protein VL283_00470 [Candidatus Baltobacteraceae bacterium]|nr:hypothetical protein [Candidatus Baltobacteraceae bacterium]